MNAPQVVSISTGAAYTPEKKPHALKIPEHVLKVMESSVAEGEAIKSALLRSVKPKTLGEDEAVVYTLSEIETKELVPVWPGRLYKGKLSLFAGDGGLGKSMVTLDLAARISRGEKWPASVESAPLGHVVILASEDDPHDTIRPRLESVGADLSKIHILTGEVKRDDEKKGPVIESFRMDRHLYLLEREFKKWSPVMCVIDPITQFLSKGLDSHANADVRGDLSPLAMLAQKYGVSVVMISHLNKSTTLQGIYRVNGSTAFTAIARSVGMFTEDPGDEDRRLFFNPKANLTAKIKGALAFRVIAETPNRPKVVWEDQMVDYDLNEAMAGPTPRERAREEKEGEAAEWLKGQLATEPQAAADVWRRAKNDGIPERKLKKALKALGVLKEPMGYQGSWHYRLPESGKLSETVKASESVPLCPTLSESTESLAKPLPTESNRVGQSRTETDAIQSRAVVSESEAMCEYCAADNPARCVKRDFVKGSCWARKHPEAL